VRIYPESILTMFYLRIADLWGVLLTSPVSLMSAFAIVTYPTVPSRTDISAKPNFCPPKG
jgi:hypothetical protein